MNFLKKFVVFFLVEVFFEIEVKPWRLKSQRPPPPPLPLARDWIPLPRHFLLHHHQKKIYIIYNPFCFSSFFLFLNLHFGRDGSRITEYPDSYLSLSARGTNYVWCSSLCLCFILMRSEKNKANNSTHTHREQQSTALFSFLWYTFSYFFFCFLFYRSWIT